MGFLHCELKAPDAQPNLKSKDSSRQDAIAIFEAGERELDLGHGVAEDEAINRIRAASDPPHDWADYMRYRFEEGSKAFARGEAVSTKPDALMDSVERELGLS